MSRIIVSIFLVSVSLFLVSCASSSDSFGGVYNSSESLEYIPEEDLYRLQENVVVVWNSEFEEIDRWVTQLEKAIFLLSEDIIRTIINGAQTDLRIIFEPSDHWRTAAFIYWSNTLLVNTTPDPNHPFDYEYISENGYLDEEILYIWIHEIGHAWQHYSNPALLFKDFFRDFHEGSPTKYGFRSGGEDFAESFALYILLPDYMTANFPLRYAWLRGNVFNNQEYLIDYEIPSSIYARLSEPFN